MEEVALRNFLRNEVGSLSKHNGHGMENISSKSNFTLFKVFHDYSLPFMLFNMDEVVLDGMLGHKRPGGGYSQNNWVGVCGPLSKTLTLFMTKICDCLYPIYDLNLTSILCFRRGHDEEVSSSKKRNEFKTRVQKSMLYI